MPPKIAIESHKNSTQPRRSERGNKKGANKLSANTSNSKNDLQEKISDSTSVAEPNTVKAVVPIQQAEVSKPKRTRHRKQVKSSWTREITKTNREHGKAYQGYQMTEKGIVHGIDRSERKLGPRCSSNYCRTSKKRNCHDVDEGKRVSLFERFWSDLGWDQKKIYVASLVDVDDTNMKVSQDSRRSNTMQYFLKIDNKRIQVCKPFFMSSLGLNDWMVKNWATINTDGMIPAKTLINARRKADRPPSNKEIEVQEKKDFLIKFFNELPKMPSHYCRERTDKQYIEPNFQSLAQLYRYYQMCWSESKISSDKSHGIDNEYVVVVVDESNGVVDRSNGVNKLKSTSLSYGYFCDLFKELKLGLYQPRKDRCDTCVAYENGNITEKEYNDHILQKNRARKEKDDDKKKAIAGEARVFVWDVEAVKLAPQNKSGILYYKSKLKNHNFSIYDLKSTDCTNNWWNEADGGMDSSMFTTCAIDFLDENCNDDLPIIIWSDGCGYQNRNQILSSALLEYAIQYKKTIQQKFLIKGHTQMEVDNVHALIEKKSKGRNIDLPSDYITVTEEARLTTPLKARLLHHGDFRNYNDPRFFRYNSIRPGKSVGEDTVHDLRMLHYDPNGTISFKVDFDNDLKPLPRKPQKPALSYQKLKPLYHEELKISVKRYNDLQDLKIVLPSKAHAFYDNLKHE